MKKPLLSIIIPIYNVDKYITQTVESVLHQNLSFNENIELILVDDGSTDRSSTIARNYSDKYPKNIVYKRLKNGGVSRARNVGLGLARGKFVHFLDGDDMISKNFYTESIKFLNDQPGEVDFVASKLMFFDDIIDSHPLNYKFKKTRVIDVKKEPDSPILHVTSCVFRRSSIREKEFNTRLSIAEDAVFLCSVLVAKKKYGVLKKPKYYYRKRADASSALGGRLRNKDNYLSVAKYAYAQMLDLWEEGDASTVEHTILYDLSHRLDQREQLVLTPEEEAEYKKLILSIAAGCGGDVIASSRHLSVHQKLYILKNKYGDELFNHIRTTGDRTYFDERLLFNHQNNLVYLDFFTKLSDNKYKIEGYITGLSDVPNATWAVNVSGKRTELTFVPRFQLENSFLGDVYEKGGAFEVVVDVASRAEISFDYVPSGVAHTLRIETGPFTKFGALKLTYRRDSDRLFKRTRRSLKSYPYSKIRHAILEARMIIQIILNWRLNTAKAQFKKLLSRNLDQLSVKAKMFEALKPLLFILEAVALIPRAFILRTTYYIVKPFKKRPIWLISDRGTAAGDNGEALFKYIATRDDCLADVYFVISKKAKDFSRLKTFGKVMPQEGLRYKLMFLLADKIISSQADVETTNPFIRQQDHYVDLFDFDFVFLQHGIIRHNLSSWLNRFNKNITLFVTSAQKEYDSLFKNPYYYKNEQVILSGLPRYDYLENKPANKLILAPTYRKNLVKKKTDRLGRRGYDSSFIHTFYRNFYNNVMNDPRLVKALQDNDMTGEFYLHPVFSAQKEDFNENSVFKVMQFPYDYRTAFSEGNLLISDHSSVVFDFAYLKKPVAYAHFDVRTFFQGHSYDKSNFFSDEDDGFGGVYYDYDTLIEGVVDSINSGCIMADKYKKRVDSFFYKVDKNNSKRVYGAIIGLDKPQI